MWTKIFAFWHIVNDPSYPEEDDEDGGDPLSDKEERNPPLTNEGDEEEDEDLLSDKENQEGDGGDDNKEQNEPQLFGECICNVHAVIQVVC